MRACVRYSLVFLCLAQPLAAQTHSVVNDPLKPLPEATADLFKDDGSLANSSAAGMLVEATLGKRPGADVKEADFHCLIHVVKWSDELTDDASAKQIKSKIDAQHWYLYQGGSQKSNGTAFATRRRIFGSTNVWLLYVHLNSRLKPRYSPAYAVSLKKKTPTNLSHLTEILGLYQIPPALPGASAAAEPKHDYWGGDQLDMSGFRTADVTVTPIVLVKQIIVDENNVAVGTVDPPAKLEMALGGPETFDNEGRFRWDAGLGVPIRKAKDLTFDTAAGTAAPTTVDRTQLLAMLSVYPWPVDLRSSEAASIPHLLVGIDVARKTPADRLFVGAGWGPVFANFFVGAMAVKPPASAPSTKRDWQFVTGIYVKGRGLAQKAK